jgi:hypothetical protein
MSLIARPVLVVEMAGAGLLAWFRPSNILWFYWGESGSVLEGEIAD